MRKKTLGLLAAAVAAISLASARPAAAQYAVPNANGRALDANNGIGSGGQNGTGTGAALQNQNNQLVTGNVSGLNYFHSNVGYTDPLSFQGRDWGSVPTFQQRGFGGNANPDAVTQTDILNRDTAGSPSFSSPTNVVPVPRSFYGVTSGVVPPAGYGQIGSTGTYTTLGPTALNPGDTRLPYETGESQISNQPLGSDLTPGQVDPTAPNAANSFSSVSPLYGSSQWSLSQAGDSYLPAALLPSQADGSRLTSLQILKMRQELNQQPNQTQLNTGQGPANGQTPGQPGSSGQLNPSALPNGALQPLDTSAQAQLASPQLTSGLLPAAPLSSEGANTSQTLRQQFASPTQQSAQYDALKKRLTQFNQNRPMTDQQAHELFLQEQRARAASPDALHGSSPAIPGMAAPGATPGMTAPGMTPPGMTPPGVTPPGLSPGTGAPGAGPETPGATPSAPGIPSAAPQTPLQVQNFATGVEARGLHDLLQSADDLMRKGKFTSAMDEYDNAAAVAPNNPLVVIGRANAELAASLYSRAEADLRAAYGSDQAVMMAQYDLKDLIGEDRLKYLSDDLKQIADSSPNDSTPVFLLAYIDYNDHQEAQAAAYLDLAQKREGGNDDLIKSLMTHWTLPTTQPAGDMNK